MIEPQGKELQQRLPARRPRLVVIRSRWPRATLITFGLAGAGGLLLRLAGYLEQAQYLLSVAHLCLGLVVFLLHGRRRLTATGLYFLSTGLLFGLAGLLVALDTVYDSALWNVTFASLFADLGVLWLLTRRGEPAAGNEVRRPDRTSARLPAWLAVIGAGYIAAGFVLKLAAPLPLTQALGFNGSVFLSAAGVAASWRGLNRTLPPYAVAAAAGLVIYYRYFFAGLGRLNLITLLLIPLVLYNGGRPRLWHKRLAVAAIIPILVVAAVLRLTLVDREVSAQAIVTGYGLGSFSGPLETFAAVTHLDDIGSPEAFPRQRGTTFLVAAIAPVPRGWWAGKPVALGIALSERLSPLAPPGHSLAVLSYGEWYVNFGWLGIPAAAVLTALVLRRLDGLLYRTSSPQWTRRRGVASIAAALIAAGLLDYVWAGSFAFASRTGVRLLALIPIAVVARSSDR